MKILLLIYNTYAFNCRQLFSNSVIISSIQSHDSWKQLRLFLSQKMYGNILGSFEKPLAKLNKP